MILSPKARSRKTVEDFMRLPEEMRVELIDGDFFLRPNPRLIHQKTLGNVMFSLSRFADDRRLGEVILGPLDVHLPSGDIVKPDIIYVATSNLGIVQDWIRGVPDLIIEVISPDGVERDRIVKRDLYAQNGIREYWIVDPEMKTVEVFSLAGNRYEPNGYFESNDFIVSALLPEFKTSVADLFA